MGEAALSKRVLQAVVDAHPDDGSFAVTRVDIKRGWGNLVNVTIHVGHHDDGAVGHARAVRDAVERALGTERFRVRLREDE